MDDMLLNQYKILVDYLGKALGPDYEIVLHDLRNDSNRIIAIANGQISGREVGDSINDESFNMLIAQSYENHDYLVNYKGLTKDNYVIRSSTMFIKNANGDLLGMLCINFSDYRFIELHDMVLSIAHPLSFLNKYSTHTLQTLDFQGSSDTGDAITENLSPDIGRLMDSLYTSAISSINIPVDRMTQEERIKIVGQLQSQGFFKLKGAVHYAAKKLQCSSASIYRYLNESKSQ